MILNHYHSSVELENYWDVTQYSDNLRAILLRYYIVKNSTTQSLISQQIHTDSNLLSRSTVRIINRVSSENWVIQTHGHSPPCWDEGNYAAASSPCSPAPTSWARVPHRPNRPSAGSKRNPYNAHADLTNDTVRPERSNLTPTDSYYFKTSSVLVLANLLWGSRSSFLLKCDPFFKKWKFFQQRLDQRLF